MNVFNETIERYGTVPLFVCLCVWRTNQAEPTRDSDANKTRTCGRFNVGVFGQDFWILCHITFHLTHDCPAAAPAQRGRKYHPNTPQLIRDGEMALFALWGLEQGN